VFQIVTICPVIFVVLQRIFVVEDENDTCQSKSRHLFMIREREQRSPLTFVKVAVQVMFDLFTGRDATDGGDLRGQCAQVRSDFFGVGGRDTLFELEQDGRKGQCWGYSTYRCDEWSL